MKKRIFKYFVGFALIIAGAYALLYYLAEPIADHKYFNPDGFMVIAHRGGRSLGPESTLFTFQRAADLGVDVLEIDILSTKNGKLVVIHDDTVNRTTDGKGTVANFTLAELKKLDAGFRWSPDSGRTYPMRGKGLTVPSLAEVFTAFPKIHINIEIKDGQIRIKGDFGRKTTRTQAGLAFALINNMIKGVTQGYVKELEIVGVGYRAQIQNKNLNLQLQFSHPVVFPIPEDIEIKIPKPTQIVIQGIDKQRVGDVAAEIRAILPPEPYKGKGIRYKGEYVRKKIGKAVTK